MIVRKQQEDIPKEISLSKSPQKSLLMLANKAYAQMNHQKKRLCPLTGAEEVKQMMALNIFRAQEAALLILDCMKTLFIIELS